MDVVNTSHQTHLGNQINHARVAKHTDPYRLDNACSTSNVPLLSYLYGGINPLMKEERSKHDAAVQPRPISPLRSSRLNTTDGHHFGAPCNALPSGIGGVPIPPFDEEIPREPCFDVAYDLRNLQVAEEMKPEGGQEISRGQEEDSEEKTKSEEETSHSVPFHIKVKEVRRRISEQLHVHRELDQACRDIDRVADEVRIFRSTQSTAAFLTRINQSNFVSFDLQASSSPLVSCAQKKVDITTQLGSRTATRYNSIFSDTSNGSHDNNNSATTIKREGMSSTPQTPTNPFLAEVLSNFTKNNPTVQTSMLAKAQKKRREEIMANTIRPPAPPAPYRRVLLVPVAPPSEGARDTAVVNSPHKEERTALHTSTKSNKEEIHTNEDSYTGDFDTDFSDISAIHKSPDGFNTIVEDGIEDLVRIETDKSSQVSKLSPTSRSSISDRPTVTATVTATPTVSTIEESIENDYSSDSAHTVTSSSALPSTANSSSIVSDVEQEIEEEGVEKSSERMQEINKEAAKASLVLKEFFITCKRANDLALQLSASGRNAVTLPMSVKSRPQHTKDNSEPLGDHEVNNSHESAGEDSDTLNSGEESSTEIMGSQEGAIEGPDEWLKSMRVDVKDIKRLSRFTQRLQQHLQSMDAQRKIRAVKRKILERAQQLSRARKKMKENPKKRLKAVLREDENSDVIEDLMADFSGGSDGEKVSSGDDIADELDSLLYVQDSLGGNSVDGELSIEEDYSFSGDGSNVSNDGVVDDEIEDDFSDDLENSQLHSDEVIDEMVDIDVLSDEIQALENSILDEMEDEFADRLVEVSNVSEVMDEIELPDYTDVEDQVGLSKVKKSSDVNDDNSFSSDIVDEVDGSLTDAASATSVSKARTSSIASEHSVVEHVEATSMSSHSWDADVDTIIPNSTSGSEYAMDESNNSSFSVITHNSLERDFFWTQDRRKLALRRGPEAECPTFTQLYDPLVSSESSSKSSFATTSSSSDSGKNRNSSFRFATQTEQENPGAVDKPTRKSTPPNVFVSGTESQMAVACSKTTNDESKNNTDDVSGKVYTIDDDDTSASVRVQSSSNEQKVIRASRRQTEMVTASIEGNIEAFSKVHNSPRRHTVSERVKQAAADFVALDQWKLQQKKLVRELLFPISVNADHLAHSESETASSYASSDDSEDSTPRTRPPSQKKSLSKRSIHRRTALGAEKLGSNNTDRSHQKDQHASPPGSFSYHWGMVESMLHCRFENVVQEDPLETMASPFSCGYSSSCDSDVCSSIYS